MNNFNSLASKQGHKGQTGTVEESRQRSDKQKERQRIQRNDGKERCMMGRDKRNEEEENGVNEIF